MQPQDAQQAASASQTQETSRQVLEKLRGKKLIITPDALAFLLAQDNPTGLADRIISNPPGVFVTKANVQDVLSDLASMQKAKEIIVKHAIEYHPPAAEAPSQLKILEEEDVTGKSSCTGKVEDFVELFRDRLRRTSRLLKGRASEAALVPLAALKNQTDRRKTRVIGMVRDRRTTKNGFTIIEIEDEETLQACLLPKDAPASLATAANDLVRDEVIAFDGIMSGSLFIIKDITWPEMPFRPLKTIEEDLNVAFISDTQIGSKLFLQKQFTAFLEFLNGKTEHSEHREAAGKIKYLLVAGDVVDGVGIYPSQERELATKDVYTQFEIFSEFIKNIPPHIEVIVGPGNHDPVRNAQPRPRIVQEFSRELEKLGNVHFVGDPAWLELHGFKTLMFHGDGFYTMTSAMSRLSNAHMHPETVAVEMLKRRHLCPPYGDNPIVPEKRDYLFINEPPDIVHFGHVHRNGYANYRGTMIVNSGTWQDVTDYILKQGHEPTPCQLPLYNLKTASLSVINFKDAV